MLDVIYREETLINVIKSVTKNGRSILLTAFLAVILIYLFSIVGYMFFQSDFLMEVEHLPGIEQHVKGDCELLHSIIAIPCQANRNEYNKKMHILFSQTKHVDFSFICGPNE